LNRKPLSDQSIAFLFFIYIENDVSVQCKRAKYTTVRCGLFFKLWFRLTLLLIWLLSDLSPLACVTFIYLSLVSMYMLKSFFNEAATLEQASLQLLRSFQIKTKNLRGRDLRYLTRAIKSLPVFSFYLGVPGFNILQVKHSTVSSAFLFILDTTISLLLTF
jgi:hypothetical protein